MAVVGLPSAVTGLAAISIMEEMTFMPGRHSSSNFSHVAGASGLAWRRISNCTVLVAMIPQRFGANAPASKSNRRSFDSPFRLAQDDSGMNVPLSFGGVVAARPGLDELHIHVFEFETRAFNCSGEAGLRGLQKLFVVAIGKIGLVVRAARFIALNCAEGNATRELKHVVELAGEGEAGIGPLALVAEVHVVEAIHELDDFLVGFLESLVVADDGGVLGHGDAELAPELEGIFGALVVEQLVVDFGLALYFGSGAAVALDRGESLRVLERDGSGGESAVDAGDQRVCAEAICAVVLVLALTGGEEAGDVGHLVEVDPEAAHGVVHAGEDLHGVVVRVDADEFLVDFEDAAELVVEGGSVDVREVEVDHRLAFKAEAVLVDDFVNGAGGDVAWNEVAVFRVPLFEEVEALGFGDLLEGAAVAGLARDPYAAAFAAGGLGHEAELVFAGDRRGVHLDEFAVGVVSSLLEDGGLRGAGADDGVGALAEDGSDAAGGEQDGFGGEGAKFHCAQVHCGDAAACAFAGDDGGEELPAFEFADLAFGLVAAHLFIERVEKLLAGGGSGEGGAVIERAAEAAEVEKTLGGAVEGHAHAVEQVDDGWRSLAHGLDGRLVGEEVAAVDGVVKVLPGGVSLALEVLGGVDAALGAHGVRTLDRDDGEEVDRAAGLGDFDDRREPGESAANHDDSG